MTANQSLQVLRNGTAVGLATVDGTGWTFTDAQVPDGSHQYTARAIDVAGNQGAASQPYQVTVITVPPSQTASIGSIVDDQPTLVGVIAPGGATDDRTPTLNGTLSAPLGAFQSVQVLRNGAAVGTAVVSGGTWSFTDATLANGAYSYAARVVDAAGNVGATSAAYAIQVTFAPPAQTVSITSIIDNQAPVTGVVPTGGYTNDTTPTLSGVLSGPLAAGQTLQILRGNTVVGSISPAGTSWTFTDAAVTDGVHSYTARVVGSLGTPGAASGAYLLRVDTVPPATTLNTVAGNNVVDAAEAAAGVTISGTAEPGSSVRVTWGVGVLTATAGSNGQWSTTWSSAVIPSSGATTVTATATDLAGNVGAAVSQAVSVVRQLVGINSIIDNMPPGVGSVPSNGTTNDTTPTLSGAISAALAAGQSVQVLRNGTAVGTAVMSGLQWTFTDTAPPGTHQYTARVVDSAGGAGTLSNPYTITISAAAGSGIEAQATDGSEAAGLVLEAKSADAAAPAAAVATVLKTADVLEAGANDAPALLIPPQAAGSAPQPPAAPPLAVWLPEPEPVRFPI
ncbi:MAG TPA: Ig-like domain-containing protein [Burkholderiaceae bacterium]|nr:Ig-like domain-containing protein [Burkholderiaceae bacterium]